MFSATWQRVLRLLHTLAATVIVMAALVPHQANAQEMAATDLEALPAMVYGSSAIPPGASLTTVTGRFIGPNSLVLVTPDTTGLPSTATPVNGSKVISRFEGGFNVITRTRVNTGSSGAPFNWVVFNARTSGPFTIGTGRIPAGRNAVSVTDSVARANSFIVLTADVSGILNDVATPNLRIQERRDGGFTVATLDLSRPTNDLPFTYLIVNDQDCFVACRSAIEAGTQSTGISTFNMNKTAGVFVTPDMTGSPAAGSAVNDLKVRHRGAGVFRVATTNETTAGTRIPFTYVIIQPPPRWEEIGPTGRSGNTWSVAVHPTAFATQYAGSSYGGVWKTGDAGMTWRLAWNLPLQGIVRIVVAPNSPNTVYAAARDGTVYQTTNGGENWTSLGRPPGYDGFEGGSNGSAVFLASPFAGLIYLCTHRGLHAISLLTPWTSVAPTAETSVQCTDVVATPDGTVYAGFRESGVWRQSSGVWKKIKAAVGSYTWNPGTKNQRVINNPVYRIAVGPSRIAILSECRLYLNDLANLNLANVENTWTFRSSLCSGSLPGGGSVFTYNGYASSIAMSPENQNRLIAAGTHAYLSTDYGVSWNRVIHDGSGTVDSVDFHQIYFYPADPTKVIAVSDQGPRYSYDRGATWIEAPFLDRLVDGPPVLEFYNLTVSDPDMFGRVWVGGHIQDVGGTYLAGNYSGFEGPEGEFGFSVVAPRPINLSTPLRSRFRTYTNSHGLTNPAPEMTACDFELPGPNYAVPDDQQHGYYGPSSLVCNGATFSPALPDNNDGIPSAIAVSPNRYDLVVVGTRSGLVYMSRPGSDGKTYDQVGAGKTPASAVTALHFMASGKILIGYDNGDVYLTTTTFNAGSTPTFAQLGTPTTVNRSTIIDFANMLGDETDVYVANTRDVFRSTNGGASWSRVTGHAAAGGQVLTNNLATGVQIVGLARDNNYPFLYVATGARRVLADFHWTATSIGTPGVFRSSTPVNGTWTDFGQALPARLPIVDIGVASNQALYVATQGRGIWWRRDVSAVPPNSGVNAPESAAAFAAIPVDITSTCSDPEGWRHIHTLAFKLGMGLGPGDGAPFALWVEYDEEANLVRFFDPAGGETQTGAPGEAKVLQNEFVALDLARTTVGALDAEKKTVQINWALTLREAARGQTFEQFLQVQNDGGDTTSWDEVGTVQVATGGPALFLPSVSR